MRTTTFPPDIPTSHPHLTTTLCALPLSSFPCMHPPTPPPPPPLHHCPSHYPTCFARFTSLTRTRATPLCLCWDGLPFHTLLRAHASYYLTSARHSMRRLYSLVVFFASSTHHHTALTHYFLSAYTLHTLPVCGLPLSAFPHATRHAPHTRLSAPPACTPACTLPPATTATSSLPPPSLPTTTCTHYHLHSYTTSHCHYLPLLTPPPLTSLWTLPHARLCCLPLLPLRPALTSYLRLSSVVSHFRLVGYTSRLFGSGWLDILFSCDVLGLDRWTGFGDVDNEESVPRLLLPLHCTHAFPASFLLYSPHPLRQWGWVGGGGGDSVCVT